MYERVSHLEGSSTSVGRHGHCHSLVIAVKNVDVHQPILLHISSDGIHICDPSARNQSHVGRVRFPQRAEMHGRGHITDSCFIAFITSKIC